MATNGGGEHTKIRDDFFEILNAYKRVDSGGRWKNNIGGPIGDAIQISKILSSNG